MDKAKDRIDSFDVVVIGAGIVGAAVARELSRYELSICLLDKASDVSAGSSKANSGIVHAGFDAKHGSLKAKYNVLGSKLYPSLAQELGFAFKNNGSLVLAFSEEEKEALEGLIANGQANGVEKLQLLDAQQLRALEPNVSEEAIAALYAPTGGITNPYEATLAFAENAVRNGAEVRLDTQVLGIAPEEGKHVCEGDVCRMEPGEGFKIQVQDLLTGEEYSISAKRVVNAAGVFSDRVAQMVGCAVPSITARRGEYVILDKREGNAFTCTMFQAPTAAGKGVLVSPTVDGNIIVGPNAHAVDRDADNGGLDTTREGIDEVLSKARKTWPQLSESAVITRFSGLRATPGNGDFVLGEAPEAPGFFNALGIESPGLTAAPALAIDLAEDVAKSLDATAKADFDGHRDRPRSFIEMNEEERAQAIAEDPAWSRMVCRCEQVSEAQIREAINSPIPATTLDALKWRTRAGMGRCHAGFCSPGLIRIIAEETGCALDQVRKGNAGSYVAFEGADRKSGPLEQGLEEAAGADAAADITVDLAVVGGGAAGIAAALSADKAGVENILLIDREDELGGILKQCIHPGFGLERYRQELTGPEYAERDRQDLAATDIQVLQRTTVTDIKQVEGEEHPYVLQAVGPQEGTLTVHAQAVVLATGSRERSAGQVDLNGDRPAGVFAAGCAQNMINLMGIAPGKRVVIYGSGDIGLIMARRLAWEGAESVTVVERAKKPKGLRRNVKQCLEDNGIPILLSQSVVRVFGKDRVEGVEIVHTDKETKRPILGTEYRMDCDTLLLSCGLIPEQDLLVNAGGAAASFGSCDTTWPGVFFCGNASSIHDVVDNVTVEGEYIGRVAAAWILGQPRPEEPEGMNEGESADEVSSDDPVAQMEGAEQLTCICCPKGCQMFVAPSADEEDGFVVSGNQCKRGRAYAIEEMTAPKRTLTSTVRCKERLEPVSVRSDATILKSQISDCLKVLEDLVVTAPLQVGDVIVEDICGTGANIIATKSLV